MKGRDHPGVQVRGEEEERDMTNTVRSKPMYEEVDYTVECRDVATQKWEHGPMWYYVDVATSKIFIEICRSEL